MKNDCDGFCLRQLKANANRLAIAAMPGFRCYRQAQGRLSECVADRPPSPIKLNNNSQGRHLWLMRTGGVRRQNGASQHLLPTLPSGGARQQGRSLVFNAGQVHQPSALRLQQVAPPARGVLLAVSVE
jgi:hypothetical protein